MNRNELADSVNALVERSMPVDVEEDAPYIAATVEACRGRFLGTGTKYQISENEQSFERSSIGTMLKGMREELQDGINYAAMLDILRERQQYPANAADDCIDFALAERLKLYCETVTCLLVDFDRELQEMLAELGYADDGKEYVDTLADEVNATVVNGPDWRVVNVPFFIMQDARSSVALDGETRHAPIALGAGANESEALALDEPYEVDGEHIDIPIDRRSQSDTDISLLAKSYVDELHRNGESMVDDESDVEDYAVDLARLYDDGCTVTEDDE